MIKELIKLASHLDSKGFVKEADYLDGIIKKAQVVESDGTGRYSAEIVAGPPNTVGSTWKDWTDGKKPGTNQGFLEGYDVNTSQSYTARELQKVLIQAHSAAKMMMKEGKSEGVKNQIDNLNAAITDLNNLIGGGGKFIMYQK